MARKKAVTHECVRACDSHDGVHLAVSDDILRRDGVFGAATHIGAEATLLIRKETLTLKLAQEKWVHRRVPATRTVQRLPEHRREMLQVLHGERKLNYYCHQCLLELGEQACKFIEELVHANPGGTWSPVVNALFELASSYEKSAMCAALGEAHAQRNYTAEAVAAVLSRRAVA